jgi:hypothetical protein
VILSTSNQLELERLGVAGNVVSLLPIPHLKMPMKEINISKNV